jgi:hypothetical protein
MAAKWPISERAKDIEAAQTRQADADKLNAWRIERKQQGKVEK